jgi:hypothetical protein
MIAGAGVLRQFPTYCFGSYQYRPPLRVAYELKAKVEIARYAREPALSAKYFRLAVQANTFVGLHKLIAFVVAFDAITRKSRVWPVRKAEANASNPKTIEYRSRRTALDADVFAKKMHSDRPS